MRGYCRKCYRQGRRNGTLERKHVSNKGPCSVEGCGKRAFAKGFCSLHYQQKHRHPLHRMWANLRSRAPGDYPPTWDDFNAFLADVGDKPSTKHHLRRTNPDKPWSKENSKWQEAVGVRVSDPAYAHRWHVKNKRGLPDGEEEAMFARQEGKCAICALPLGRLDEETGRPIKTCIDHNHRTDRVRGLLCDPCNKGLGMFNDDLAIIRQAVTYMEKNDGEKD
jgi:hypothetical protein